MQSAMSMEGKSWGEEREFTINAWHFLPLNMAKALRAISLPAAREHELYEGNAFHTYSVIWVCCSTWHTILISHKATASVLGNISCSFCLLSCWLDVTVQPEAAATYHLDMVFLGFPICKQIVTRRIWAFLGGDYEECRLLGCGRVWVL
jgi:hypothetical protein